MNSNTTRLARRYQSALLEYVKQGSRPFLQKVRGLGDEALVAGLHTLDLARIHEQALRALELGHSRDGALKRSQAFFAEAITPIEDSHRAALQAKIRLDLLNRTLGRRTAALAATNVKLKQEIAQRRAIERSLRESKRHHSQLLGQAQQLQKQLRYLSHQILSAQEEERKKISRELHDVIAQTLTGINVQLARLKKEATLNTETLEKNILATQTLVEESVSIVHRFARELRPTMLDDLGLIPALHAFMKTFTEQTGIRVSLTAAAAVEQLNGIKRTVLYRVTQEALTNVARHAQASRVEVSLRRLHRHFWLQIQDNGKGFRPEGVLHDGKHTRLGLLGMRERVEMVSGKLTFKSTLGQGTIIEAKIPVGNGAGRTL